MKNNTTTKVLIELPTWLGDCVMSTPAIENIIKYYIDIELTIIGTLTFLEVIKNHPKVIRTIEVDSKFKFIINQVINLEKFDAYFTFRGSNTAKILKLIIRSNHKYQFNNKKFPLRHQVQKYSDFVNDSLNTNYLAGHLFIYQSIKGERRSSKILGINPGGSYGMAKRWYPDQFAKVAIELASQFEIIIFGGANYINSAKEIEDTLIEHQIENYQNLAGKTSISELIKHIASLDIFITGDSGPMHIAAGLNIPTIAIFGPTNDKETSQWKNQNSIIIKKNLNCQPCMKRKCPLNHHKCMKLIKSSDVIANITPIIS